MIGAEVEGRYRVESELGAGGVGTVYRALDAKLNRRVALKVLQEGLGRNRELRQRFEREARALAALSHPHIVTITDYGILDDTPFLVTELLEGSTLAERLEAGALEPDFAIHVMRQLLSALEFAHATGLVHRDVKPGNVFLQSVPGAKPHVKLLDFGLAKFLAPDGKRALVTRAGQIVGTPWYMAPEQIVGEGKSATTDVYAAGIILFEMLTGKTPFNGGAQEVMRQHLLVPLPAVESVHPGRVPAPELDTLLRRATSKRATDRFQDAGEMARALDALPEPAIVDSVDGESRTAKDTPAPRAPVEEVAPTDRVSDKAPTAGVVPPRGSFGETVQQITTFVGRFVVCVVVAISLAAALGAASVVVLLANPELSERWPMLTDVLRKLPGLGELVPERQRQASRGPTAETTERPPQAPPSAIAPHANAVPPPTAPPAAERARSGPVPSASHAPPAGPPLWSNMPTQIARYRRIVEGSRALTKREMVAIHQYNAAHPDDPRGHLLLGRSHMRRGWKRDAFNAYTGAYKTSPRAREDVHMLEDVVSLVASGMRDGPAFVAEAYGRAALGAVEKALGQRQPSADAVERLQRLKMNLEALRAP